jgi:hypothetical protein
MNTPVEETVSADCGDDEKVPDCLCGCAVAVELDSETDVDEGQEEEETA